MDSSITAILSASNSYEGLKPLTTVVLRDTDIPPSQAVEVAEKARALLLETIRAPPALPGGPVQITCPGCGVIESRDARDFMPRVWVTLAAAHAVASRHASRDEKAKSSVHIPLLAASGSFLEVARELGQGVAFQAAMMMSEYFATLTGAFFTGLLGPTPAPRELLRKLETTAHTGARRLFHHVSSRGLLGFAARILIERVLETFEEAYSVELGFNAEHKMGMFSSLRPSELALLAKRDKIIAKQYGEERIAKVFEHQLSLIALSFGFHVIRTQTGVRGVDLVCLGADGVNRTLFLIEAKSTKKPYSMPTKDERAMVEYVNDIRRTLIGLPPLRFALIVGPAAASTLNQKLQRLELSAGFPSDSAALRHLPISENLFLAPSPFRRSATPSSTREISCPTSRSLTSPNPSPRSVRLTQTSSTASLRRER